MSGNIAVIGDMASIICFKAVGFKTVSVRSSAETAEAVETLVNDDCFVIFITEHALQGAEHVLDKYKDSRTLAIIPIPGRYGKTGIGMLNLDSYVENALGRNILGTQDDTI
jgi:vacuolar-type H+-ATPase subunit F/Vma7